jgi:hypothetical protein
MSDSAKRQPRRQVLIQVADSLSVKDSTKRKKRQQRARNDVAYPESEEENKDQNDGQRSRVKLDAKVLFQSQKSSSQLSHSGPRQLRRTAKSFLKEKSAMAVDDEHGQDSDFEDEDNDEEDEKDDAGDSDFELDDRSRSVVKKRGRDADNVDSPSASSEAESESDIDSFNPELVKLGEDEFAV